MESLGSLSGKENNSSTKKCLNVGKNREGYGLKTLGPVLSFQTAEKPCKTAGCIITHLFLFTFYSLSKLQNNLTSVLNISIHRHRHHHLTISLSGYRARNISIAIMKGLFKALQLTQPEETGSCFNIILILSELLEPTREIWVPVSSELAPYAVLFW